jgi:hypothetical protein
MGSSSAILFWSGGKTRKRKKGEDETKKKISE